MYYIKLKRKISNSLKKILSDYFQYFFKLIIEIFKRVRLVKINVLN